MRPRIIIRCPPKKKAQSKEGAQDGAKKEPEWMQLVPDPFKRRNHEYVLPIRIPIYLRPFKLVASLFRYQGAPSSSQGGTKQFQTLIVPLCICPDIIFYLCNFLVAPIVGYLLLTGWYSVAFREMVFNVLQEEVMGPYYCNPKTTPASPLFGIYIDAVRHLLLALLIVYVAVIGVVGLYWENKVLLLMWLATAPTLYIEYFLGHTADSAYRLDVCFMAIHQLLFCFSSDMNLYWTNNHTHYKYGPARAVDLIQNSFECCGARGPLDYKTIEQLPSSCMNPLWNNNIYAPSAHNLSDKDLYLYVNTVGCGDKMIERCKAIRGLMIYGMQTVFFYHTLLACVALVALILYFAMLRTAAIQSHTFGETVRKYTFPTKTVLPRRAVGDKYKDGRMEPSHLLRLHLQTEFIKNHGGEGDGLSSELPEEAEQFVDQLRQKLGVGQEDLGVVGGRRQDPTGGDDSAGDDACGVDFLYRHVQAKGQVEQKASGLIAASRSKFLVDPKATKLQSRKGPPPKGVSGKEGDKGSVWKWEQKKRLDVGGITSEVKELAEAGRKEKDNAPASTSNKDKDRNKQQPPKQPPPGKGK